MNREINVELVRDLLDYNLSSGELTWKKRTAEHIKKPSSLKSWNTKYAGKTITTVDGKGYLHCSIFGKIYRAHRLIWLIVHGYWPDFIDHKDGNRLNNKLDNLKNVNVQQNHMNMRVARNNTSGVTGVYFNTKSKRWCAQMKFHGKTYHLGSSFEKSEAVALRKAEEKRLGFSKRHGGQNAMS